MQTCTQSLELGFNVIFMTLILHDKVVFYRNMFPRCGYICCIGVLQTHITRRFVNICVIDLSDLVSFTCICTISKCIVCT